MGSKKKVYISLQLLKLYNFQYNLCNFYFRKSSQDKVKHVTKSETRKNWPGMPALAGRAGAYLDHTFHHAHHLVDDGDHLVRALGGTEVRSVLA